MHFLGSACGVAVERAFEIAKGDDEAGLAVDETKLENVRLEECQAR